MNITAITALVAVTIIFFVSFCYVLSKMSHAYKRRAYLQKGCRNLPISLSQINYLVDTINRAKTLYLSYILHNILCLMCRLFSAIFTVCGFYMTNITGQEQVQQVFSILSVFFVLLSIYIIPQDRSKQYLLAWRQLDSHILSLHLTDYKSLSKTEIQLLFDASNKLRTQIENSLKNDEDK